MTRTPWPARLTDGSRTSGVYRLLGSAAGVADTLAAAGWRVGVVSPTSTTADLYDGLGAALQLPRYFGRNLDALWDVLTDLTGPTALVLDRYAEYARREPGHWSRLLATLTERTEVPPPFALILL